MYDLNDKQITFADLPTDDNTGISLSNIFNTLWLKKRLLISVTVLISILAFLYISQIVPRYSATTQIIIGINAAKVVDIQEVMSGTLNTDSAVMGEIEVLKSRELAHKIMHRLHLDQYQAPNPNDEKPGFFRGLSPKNLIPDTWKEAMGLVKIDNRTPQEKQEAQLNTLTNAFLSKLTIAQIKRTQVINLTYESENPKTAAKIANEIADSYIIEQLQAKFDATKKATDWLNDQLGELKLKVESSEHAVQNYRKTHNLLEISKGNNLTQQQLGDINSQLIMAHALRMEAEAKYNQVQAITENGRDIETVAEVLNSPLVSGLRQQESEVQRKHSEMLVEYGARHPRMIQIEAELTDIQSKVKSEIKKVSATLLHNLELTRVHESSLSSSLSQMESKTGGNNQAEIELHALEREANANKALFENFLGRVKETASTQGIAQADARVISYAETSQNASYPKKNLMLTISVLGALFFGVALVFVIEMLNPGVRSPEQIEALFKMATMGIIPIIKKIEVEPYKYLLTKPHSALAEAINTLRISLSLLNPDAEVKSVLITSSVPSEGKSTLSSLLASHSATSGKKVVLVDTDLRRPTIGKIFGLEKNTLGLTDLLLDHTLHLKDVLVNDPATGLKILTRGHSAFINPIDLFSSHRMKALIDELREQFDLVILDSAPLMAVPDTRILAGLVDKTLFIVKWDSTPKKVITSALQLLKNDGHNNLAGMVLQKVNLEQYGRHGYGGSGYYYSYGRYKQYYTS